MSSISIFELEKKILKAQDPSEIDTITEEMDNQQLRDMIKLLIDRLTPENIKINRILNSWQFVNRSEIQYGNELTIQTGDNIWRS